uniref:Putative chymotrypsin inhibitor n=1 Tax=Nyssomyia neivai TaxID=330878 RepID=A0A1L8DPH2_9DIPT
MKIVFILLALGVCATYAQIACPDEKPACGVNEEYRCCGPACDEYCDGHDCGIRYFVCPNKCYCAQGYKRNNAEECIPIEDCSKAGPRY